ncbi:unnamed protein product [Coregonus sp. 'balchen']|nr:unnamed protein product [Coregonus sp. 'balchen']
MAYEFSQKPKSWSQAHESCKERGGKLLRDLNCKTKSFLQDFSKERHTKDLTWWCIMLQERMVLLRGMGVPRSSAHM